jgi:hypothetical protein
MIRRLIAWVNLRRRREFETYHQGFSWQSDHAVLAAVTWTTRQQRVTLGLYRGKRRPVIDLRRVPASGYPYPKRTGWVS